MRLRTRFCWTTAAIAAVVTLAAGVAPASATPSVVAESGRLTDLSAAPNATDGADRADDRLYAIAPGDGKTYFIFILTGLDHAAAGASFGAHVHVGPCLAGNGPAALGHFNRGARRCP